MSRVSSVEEVERALLQRWPESRLEPSLTRMHAVMDALGHPQLAVPVVHVTGTNGKTTTARMIHDLLRGSGLRVGRYTSPHQQTMRERIVLDGEPISAELLTDIYSRLRSVIAREDGSTGTPLSFFEVMTAMAFQVFAESELDAVVVEVGMGGTWDATNVADGRVAVVTPISLDHTDYLGPDVSAIAGEKSGIIKPGAALVLADQPERANRVLLDRAETAGATVFSAGKERILRRVPDLHGQFLDLRAVSGVHREMYLPLLGAHQAGNAVVALTAAEVFLASLGRRLDAATVHSTLAAVRSPGRLESIRKFPRVWVDASHNPAGMEATVAAIRELPDMPRLVVVLASLADKDAVGMLRALDRAATEVIVTETTSPRRMPVEELGRLAARELRHARVTVEPELARSLQIAIERAQGRGSSGPLAVLVTGSVVTAAEATALLTTKQAGAVAGPGGRRPHH